MGWSGSMRSSTAFGASVWIDGECWLREIASWIDLLLFVAQLLGFVLVGFCGPNPDIFFGSLRCLIALPDWRWTWVACLGDVMPMLLFLYCFWLTDLSFKHFVNSFSAALIPNWVS